MYMKKLYFSLFLISVSFLSTYQLFYIFCWISKKISHINRNWKSRFSNIEFLASYTIFLDIAIWMLKSASEHFKNIDLKDAYREKRNGRKSIQSSLLFQF